MAYGNGKKKNGNGMKNPTKDLRAGTAQKRLKGRGTQLEQQMARALGHTEPSGPKKFY